MDDTLLGVIHTMDELYNEALPTPTLTLPDTLIFNFLIISFIFMENKCLSVVIYLKGRKKSLAKGEFEPGLTASRRLRYTLYHLRQLSFIVLNYPNHTLVGRVSVNSLCQQGRVFALSVNRHSDTYLSFIITL